MPVAPEALRFEHPFGSFPSGSVTVFAYETNLPNRKRKFFNHQFDRGLKLFCFTEFCEGENAGDYVVEFAGGNVFFFQ